MNVDIEKIKRKLLVKYDCFGIILANTRFEETNEIDTAETDGKVIYYNKEFINNLSEEEQIFVVAHEICHIAFDHVFKSVGKDPELWNIATDAVINALLQKDNLKMVEGGVDIKEAVNYNAEQMYQKLLEEKEKTRTKNQENNKQQETTNNKNSNSQGQSKNEESQTPNNTNKNQESNNEHTSSNASENGQKQQNKNVGHDTHNMWKKAVEKRKQQEQNGENKQEDKKQKTREESENREQAKKKENNKDNIFSKLFNRNKNKKNQNELKEQEQNEKDANDQNKEDENERRRQEAIKRLSEQGEKEVFRQNKIDRKKRLEELREELARKSYGAGTGTNRDIRKIENIGTSDALIDWRRLLKEAVKYDIDWSYRNATIEDGVVTPYLEELPRPETEILLDTSGSVSETLLRNFLRECKSILQTSKVKVGCFDDEFYGFTEIRNESDIDNMIFHGGGGTNFDVAVNAFTRRVENKIIFTDGKAPMPDKVVDAIWVVFGKKEIHPKGGKVIHITKEALQKLYFESTAYTENKNKFK